MDKYPTQVNISEEELARLTRIYEGAYKQIFSEIAGATEFGTVNRRQILAQINAILQELGSETQNYIDNSLPDYYQEGADLGVQQLKDQGVKVPIKTGFNRIHREAIQALVSDTAEAFAKSIQGVSRSARQLMSQATKDILTQQLATGQISGDALKKVQKQLVGTLQQQGLDALVDKGNHSWSLDRYTEMLIRTKQVEARNLGLKNRFAENGFDLVQVSSHGANDVCRAWEGQVLSITGESKGYPTLREAENSGLFHPNCKHAINAVIPDLAKLTSAYDAGTKKYGPPGESLKKGYTKIAQEKLINPASEYDAHFKEKLSNVAKSGNWDHSTGPVKKADRAAEKILFDYNGDIYGMKDVNRGVIFISNPNDSAEFNQMINAVKVEFGEVSRVKINLNGKEGYLNNMINIQTSYGAQAEIQVTTIEMWNAKKKLGGDDLYHEWRVSEGKATDIYIKMKELYKNAQAETAKRLNG